MWNPTLTPTVPRPIPVKQGGLPPAANLRESIKIALKTLANRRGETSAEAILTGLLMVATAAILWFGCNEMGRQITQHLSSRLPQ